MISFSYSIDEFLDFLKGKSVIEVLAFAQEEAYEAEQKTSGGRKGAKAARTAGCDRYASDIKGFIFFLENRTKPNGVCDDLFQKFLRTARTLKGLKNEFFDEFEELKNENSN